MIWSTGAHLGHGVNLELAALVAHEKHPEGHGAQGARGQVEDSICLNFTI